MKKTYPILLLLCFATYLNAQKRFIVPDSLSKKEYNYFNEKIIYKENDSLRERLYVQSWLAKAKSEKNHNQMALAYKALIYRFDKKLRHLYVDTSVVASRKKLKSSNLPYFFKVKAILG